MHASARGVRRSLSNASLLTSIAIPFLLLVNIVRSVGAAQHSFESPMSREAESVYHLVEIEICLLYRRTL